MRRNKGFTLIELLVVIAIIGILSSVVLASLNSARTKARDAQRISDMKQYQLALELNFDDTGNYPTLATQGALPTLPTAYLATTPTDPSSGTYNYISADGSDYCVGADMEGTNNELNTCGAGDVLGDMTTDGYNYALGP